MSFRAVGKFGFILVIIGFLMPIASFSGRQEVSALRRLGFPSENLNGFQFAQISMALGESFIGLLIYMCFIFAIIGIINGLLLMVGRNVPPVLEWLALIFPLGFCIIMLADPPDILHSGVYVMLVGLIVALISQFIPNVNSTNVNQSTRKCPFCANDIKNEAIVCQFCGKDLPEFALDVGKRMICDKCGTQVLTGDNFCPKCGTQSKISINESQKFWEKILFIINESQKLGKKILFILIISVLLVSIIYFVVFVYFSYFLVAFIVFRLSPDIYDWIFTSIFELNFHGFLIISAHIILSIIASIFTIRPIYRRVKKNKGNNRK